MGRRSRQRDRETVEAPPPKAKVTAAPAKAPRESRSEVRNAAAREQLEPLAPGERPGAVTVSAVVCVLGIAFLAVGYATGLLHHQHGRLQAILSSIAILAIAAYGLWRARYWAVLGFEALLVLNIVAMFLLLIKASGALGFIVPIVVIVPAAYLFWKLVHSMARIQMPERRPRGT